MMIAILMMAIAQASVITNGVVNNPFFDFNMSTLRDNKIVKLSPFNRYISKGKVNLVFNSHSLSLIKLTYDKFFSLKNGNFRDFTEKELESLFQMNFINMSTNERDEVIKEHFNSNHRDDRFRLTIFTTTCCNARCSYCFQNGVERKNPSQDIENKIIELISQNKDKHIHLKWFGGEPLLNASMIDRITDQLNKMKISFTSSMISNGFFVEENIEKINNWQLTRIQITLDGINEKYNLIKRYIVKDDINPFAKVISGIRKLLEKKVFVSIRLNFDKNNYEDILECIDYLYKEFGNPENLRVYCHNIFGNKQNYHLDNGKNIYLFVIKKLIKCGYVKNLSQLGVRYRPLPCAAYNKNFYVIDVNGKLLKCEHFIPDPNYSGVVGDLNNGVTNKRNLNFWLSKKYPYKKCSECEFLPLCQGGCKFEALDDAESNACLPYGDCLDELLYEYYIQKTEGTNSKNNTLLNNL